MTRLKHCAVARPVPMSLCAVAVAALAACGGGSGGSAASSEMQSMSFAPAETQAVTLGSNLVVAPGSGESMLVAASADPVVAPDFSVATAGVSEAQLTATPVVQQLAEATATVASAAALADQLAMTASAEATSLVETVQATALAVTSGDALLSASQKSGYTRIASENGGFKVGTRQVVRYGVALNNRWVEKTMTGEGVCSNGFFGRDPAFGIAKSCEVLGTSPPIGVPTVAPSPASSEYSKIAGENQKFNVATQQLVRYGTALNNAWVEKTISGEATCSNGYFGRDPAYGIVKSCEVLVTIAAPAPSPNQVPVVAPAPVNVPKAPSGGNMPLVDISKIPVAAPGFDSIRLAPTTEVAPLNGGAFRTVCTFSHMSFDDPIVYPGQVGRSHLHTFFGNTLTTAASTPESIRTTGKSTCRGGIANRSSYWVPSMIDTKDGTPLTPSAISVYYKEGAVDGSKVQPIPEGLRMIAGDPSGSAPPVGGNYAMRFKCIGGPANQNDLYGSTIGNCDLGAELWVEVFFPQCWDGVNLDSPDHKSHMSYAPNGSNGHYCPTSHPVPLPGISFNVIYNVTEKNAPLRWRLASDNYDKSKPGGYSMHGDWFNGWKKDVSDAWTKNCVQAKRDCHSHLLGDGRMTF